MIDLEPPYPPMQKDHKRILNLHIPFDDHRYCMCLHLWRFELTIHPMAMSMIIGQNLWQSIISYNIGTLRNKIQDPTWIAPLNLGVLTLIFLSSRKIISSLKPNTHISVTSIKQTNPKWKQV